MTGQPAIVIEKVSKTYRAGRSVTDVPVPRLLPGSKGRGNRRPDRRDDDFVDDEDELDEVHEELQEPDRGNEEAERPADRIVHALRDVSLEVPRGARLGVLGPVGSGKSTLLKLLARITPPTSGRVLVRGRVSPPLELATSFLNPNATGRQNAFLIARLFGVPRQVVEARLPEIFELAGIEEKLEHRAGTYSNRQYRRLGTSIALHLDPDILLADDRLVAGDPEFAERVEALLEEATKRGDLTILFAASDVETVSGLCEEAIWLADGQIVERRPLERAAGTRPARRRTRRRPAASDMAAGLDALDPAQRELAEQLIAKGRSYEELAAERKTSVTSLRDEARRMLTTTAPDGGRLPAELRDQIADYMLGQTRPSHAELELLAATPEGRHWPIVIAYYLEDLAPVGLPAFPREPGPGGYEGFVPPLDPGASVLVDYLAIALGPERAREALAAATDKAIWKDAAQVKWADVAEAAGFDHEEAKAVTQRLLATRGAEGLPDPEPQRFGKRVSITAASLRSVDGLPTRSVRLCEDVMVETVIDSSAGGMRMRVQLVLETHDGEVVRLDQPEDFEAGGAGRYHVFARFPAGMLDDGHYSACVVAHVESNGHESRIELRDAFSFEALDTGESADDEDAPRNSIGPEEVEWRVSP